MQPPALGVTTDDVVDAVVSGRANIDFLCSWEHNRRRELFQHPGLKKPEQRFRALQLTIERGGWTKHKHWTTWLLQRLSEQPHKAGAEWLLEAYETQARTDRERYLAEAILATGSRPGIERIASTLDSKRPSEVVMTALLCLDPKTASRRLSEWLDPFPTEQPRLAQGLRLLNALAEDGFRAGELQGFPAKKALGWVASDPGWVPLLLKCRKDKNPNVSSPAKSALAHADPELVRAASPKPKGKKAREATLQLLGELEYASQRYAGVPIASCEGAVAFFSSPTQVEVRGLERDLPLRFRFSLPSEFALPKANCPANEDGWDRPGVHGVAIAPNAERVAISGCGLPGALGGVVVFEKQGEVGRWCPEDTLPHRLHFAASGALWVMAERDVPCIVTLDGETLEEQGSFELATFPPPAFVEAHPHPSDDVGVFQILCGQDGVWVKCIERGPKKLKVRKQKLSSVHHGSLLYGYAVGGAVAITLTESKALFRQWPEMKPLKGKITRGTPVEAAGAGDLALVTVATAGHVADSFEVFKAPKWDRAGQGAWPAGHSVVGLHGDRLITADGEQLSVWQLSL